MGSELDAGLLPEDTRGVRGDGGDGGVLRGAAGAGAIVGPSRLASSPRKVAPESVSTASPHEEQNLAVAEIFAPHFEQNIAGGDSTIGLSSAANACANS